MSSVPENKDLVQKFMAALSAGDVEGVLSYLDDSATWWVAGTIEGLSGTKNKAELGHSVARLSTATATGAIELTQTGWTAQGDRVAVETESYSVLKNGRKYNNLYHYLFIIRNGKIFSVKAYMDTDHARSVFANQNS